MKKKFLSTFLFLLVITCYSIRVYDLNANAIKVETLDFEMKENVKIENDFFYNSNEDMNGYLVCVNETELVDADELMRRYKINENDIYSSQYILVNMSFKNEFNNNKSSGINLNEYLFQQSSFVRCADRELFYQMNDFNSMLFKLPEKSNVDFVLPFGLDSEYIDINKIKKSDSYIVISLFPHKKEIKLNIS